MKKLLIILIPVLFLTGCLSSDRQPITVTRQAPEVEIFKPEKPRPISTRHVNFTVYDRTALETALEDPNFRRLISLSESDYSAIANNTQEAVRYIESLLAIVDYYEDVIRELQERRIVSTSSNE